MIQPIAIEKYCDALKDRIIFNHFNRDLFISGEGVKNLTPVPQINSFVIKCIFEKWQKETEKLKSPYFDFEHDDVKTALAVFLKSLSFHIKINKDYFELLLKEALHDAFEYLENPVVYLKNEVFDFKGTSLSNKEIKSRVKFLKLYAKDLDAFLNHPKIDQDNVRVDILMNVLDEIFTKVDKLEEEKLFVEQLSKLVPNNFINLTETKPAVEKPDKKRNFIDDLEFDGLDIPIPEPVEEIIEEETIEEIAVEVPVAEKETPAPAKVPNEIKNKEFNKTSNLAPISKFDDGISLQQKFYFVRELFGDQESKFNEAIKIADSKTSFDEACNYLWENFADQFEWTNSEDAVAEFLSILNRKF